MKITEAVKGILHMSSNETPRRGGMSDDAPWRNLEPVPPEQREARFKEEYPETVTEYTPSINISGDIGPERLAALQRDMSQVHSAFIKRRTLPPSAPEMVKDAIETSTEDLDGAAKFIAEHGALKKMVARHASTIADQHGQLEEQYNKLALQSDEIKRINGEKTKWMALAVELSTQLQFIVAGSVRALHIAAHAREMLNQEIGQQMPLPSVPGTSIEELEGLLKSISEEPADMSCACGGGDGVHADGCPEATDDHTETEYCPECDGPNGAHSPACSLRPVKVIVDTDVLTDGFEQPQSKVEVGELSAAKLEAYDAVPDHPTTDAPVTIAERPVILPNDTCPQCGISYGGHQPDCPMNPDNRITTEPPRDISKTFTVPPGDDKLSKERDAFMTDATRKLRDLGGGY